MEGHHGTCKHAALRDGTDIARTHMATESVLALCAVLERAAACLSDLPMCTHDMHLACATVEVTLRDGPHRWEAHTCTDVHAQGLSLLPINHPQHAITTGQAGHALVWPKLDLSQVNRLYLEAQPCTRICIRE